MEEYGGSKKAMDNFYSMLSEIRSSHRRDPKAATRVVRNGEDLEKVLAPLQTLHIPFSGEEHMGKYLDLHQFHHIFINSNFGFYLKYSEFVDKFPALILDDDPKKLKGTQEYKDYIGGVLEYLVSFVDRAEPLMFLDRVFKKLESEIEDQWRTKREKSGRKRPRGTTTSDVMEELAEYETVESLMELGLAKLKQALDCLGLKSGGTLQQRAERLLLVKTTPLPLDRLPLMHMHFKKEKDEGYYYCKATALMEVKVTKLCELLKDTLERTRQQVKNREGMTVKERDQDRNDDDQSDGDQDETMAAAAAANAKKLPIGWNGKPIPYWLYKLHGLDQEYKCEICGDYTYKGRRAFQNHFHQERHQHGMQCLGIPNTKAFHEITSINDAKTLWHHLQLAQESSQWNPDLYEEFEDDQDNVYPKRMFSDLVKQGLI